MNRGTGEIRTKGVVLSGTAAVFIKFKERIGTWQQVDLHRSPIETSD